METEIIQATYFDDRAYRIKEDGVYHDIASVTTQMGIEEKPFLLKWYADLGWDEARKRLNEAGDRGKRIHFALWCYLNKGVVLYNPWQAPIYSDAQIEEIKKETNGIFTVLKNQDEMLAVWKLQKFFERVKPKIIATEMTVYSIKRNIAGTLDMALLIEAGKYDVNGSKGLIIPETGIYIADLKTGNAVSDGVWTQIGPYTVAYEEMTSTGVKGGIVLHTSASTRSGIEGFATPFRTRDELTGDYKIYESLSYVWKQRNPNFGVKAFSFPSMIKMEAA